MGKGTPLIHFRFCFLYNVPVDPILLTVVMTSQWHLRLLFRGLISYCQSLGRSIKVLLSVPPRWVEPLTSRVPIPIQLAAQATAGPFGMTGQTVPSSYCTFPKDSSCL